MTILVDIKKEKNLEILQTSFLNILEKSKIWDDKDKLVSLSNQLREITEEWHSSFEPEIPIEEEDLEHLKVIVDSYSDLVDEKRFKI